MFALLHMATIVPVILLLMNQQMKLVGPFLSMIVGGGALIDVVNVMNEDEPLKHLIIKKIALAAGTALLTFHHVEQETEKDKGTSMAGVLSPRKQGPVRGAGQSGILLIGRVAICASFVFAALAEISVTREYTGGDIKAQHDQIYEEMKGIYAQIEKIKKWENVDQDHKQDAMHNQLNERNKLQLKAKNLREQDRGLIEQIIEQDGVLFFWYTA